VGGGGVQLIFVHKQYSKKSYHNLSTTWNVECLPDYFRYKNSQ
jgi:hypothetical protein